ncbi:MAG: tetratricopeptide repeat protein [Bacteroidetes bacterium]|nr:tetratricopeptide repeat protein [Bacteroidota bacterium]
MFKLTNNIIENIHFEIKEITIPESILGKRADLSFWLFSTMINNICYSLPLLVIFIIEFVVLFMDFRTFLLILLNTSAFFLSFYLEEFFHLITIIAQGNKPSIIGVSIWRLLFGREKKTTIVASTAIVFKLKQPSEKIQILANGPLLAIFNSIVVIILFNLIFDLSFIENLIFSISFTILNITSLIPLKYIIMNDGAKILQFKSDLELSGIDLCKIIFTGFIDAGYFLLTNKYSSKSSLIKVYFNEAYSLFEQENYSKAINNLEEIIRLDCNNSEAYNNLACCLEKIGNIESALYNAEKAVEIEPDDSCFIETLQSLRHLQKNKLHKNQSLINKVL